MAKNNEPKITELSFSDFLQLIEKKEFKSLLGKKVSLIGKVLNAGEKVLTLGNPCGESQNIYLISYNPDILRPLREGEPYTEKKVYVRAIIHININDEEQPVFVLEKIHILQKFNSEIYMKLLELEKVIIGELYGEMDRNL